MKKESGEIYRLDPATGTTTLFLDIPDWELETSSEQGLLGLAFHPDYAANGRFFVHLVNAAGNVEIREYGRSGSPFVANPTQTEIVLTVAHPTFGNHNGGAIAFSPNDGYLYVALGDGGGSNDPSGNAQNTNALVGKILRLDVDGDDFPSDGGRNYAIPDDNPFVGAPGADEVWAYGFRNPWRMAFDPVTGDLYIGDVGQAAREEIDFQPASDAGGRNYGWDLAEGSVGTPPAGSVLPIFEYGRDKGQAVTGGEVYRGDGPALYGAYFFADFVSGRVWTVTVVNGVAVGVTERTSQIESAVGPIEYISSFGSDGRGNIYAVSLAGDVYRLDMTALADDLGDVLSGARGDDRIYGGVGDDLLEGGRGCDVLSGGYGDDVMDGGAGIDRLGGDGGNDTIIAGGGRDRLWGGDGEDTFVFVGAQRNSADRIKDFGEGDVIQLDGAGFGLVGENGALSSAAFFRGSSAVDADDRVGYDPATGALAYDGNGSGAGGRVKIAILDRGLDLSAVDILIA